jgi:translation initiation factor 6 (eIF-6)
VNESLVRISKKPTIGIFQSESNCYSLVISKQTTLYYKVIENENQIDLILFWNNSQNPLHLQKLLS